MEEVIALKPVLKRGALLAAANWQVTLVQATADSLFKLLIATPIVGGVFLVALVAGAEPLELVDQDWRDLVATITASPGEISTRATRSSPCWEPVVISSSPVDAAIPRSCRTARIDSSSGL